ncbi:MAG: imidazole glycerol phosphate synthase subunit HisH [Alloprevotella sp.]|nr:imidazole glycerol phosphate synthase subunit HisH [Prevotellamassilia sp.]MCI6144591.1 imidazole glycerol phosphate synthase subunit HisH [Bacteroidales bacterium]MDY2624353.1 imidazole glycerol phosphate synthase subunit HisH [Alloprevotella sp.]MDY2779415.1 imidazole glycerol phosphate synthase subunit HisH [Alloprevotella sp.]MDY4059257.1 imidazole glycerol phosphate synthase subunit HisH [Alloprevotella sp.]
MIAIIDYKMGNLRSVENALHRLGAEFEVTADADKIVRADRVLLPGVGNAAEAMHNLRQAGLPEVIKSLRRPVLGICVGMQVMCRHSDEGDAECMGIFDARVKRFTPTPTEKVPHVGWNQIGNLEKKLFTDIKSGSFVYFVHSYYAELCPDTIATTRHGLLFSSALKYENFYGTQFHPEKSGDTGEQIIKNFLQL